MAGTRDDEMATLERRLEDGYRRIEDAAVKGLDVVEWETFWLRLLDQYEALCGGLDGQAFDRAA